MYRFSMIAVLGALLLPGLVGKAMADPATTKKVAGSEGNHPAAADKILPFKAAEKTFPNGLKVIVVPTGFPNIVSLQIPVMTGSRNEVEAGKSGFAHFFEHMMFRGTELYSPEKYNVIIQKAGARQNAFTTDDFTNFHITFAKDDLPKILEIEADRFQHLSYAEPAFKTEARAVLGEYNKNSSSPIRKLLEAQRDAAFTTHTYKHTTMGFIKDIEDMPNQYAYSKEFFQRWYRPGNVTIIVAGDVEPENVFALVGKYWSDWKAGDYKADIQAEPPAKGPLYVNVPWPTPTLPWVSVAFRVPGFSDKNAETPALDTLMDLEFGESSELHKRLVEQDQTVDQLFVDNDSHVDPSLYTIFARVKKMEDVVSVRDEILATFAKLRETPEPAARLNEAKANARYSFVRSLDNTETIADTLAQFVHFHRSFDTVNNYYAQLAALTPADIRNVSRKYLTDANVVVTTLAKDPMPESMAKIPALATFTSTANGASNAADLRLVTQKSVLPQVEVKLLFTTGSADDPAGKEGLAQLSASMLTEAGSKEMRIDEITKALYPMAGVFGSQVDKEQTTITASIHRDNWSNFFDIVLPQLLTPGLREEDFKRIKDGQLNALKQDLRSNNDEELGKERLQINLFASTPYAHTSLGTIAGVESITIDDVKKFIAEHYTRGNLVVGLSGDYPEALVTRLRTDLAALPAGTQVSTGLKSLAPIAGHMPNGLEVEIVKKDTRATAISFGLPIPVLRNDADFAALNVARAWLGEHRASTGRLYNRIREIRGLNYGDYAYIEFFTRPGQQFFPSANVARRSQAFELWIRPVVPVNAQMATRLALYELQKMIDNGLSQEEFVSTRDYLMKNVYLMTATQDGRLGYALDSWWFGMPEYTEAMRAAYGKLTRDDVNRAIRKYLSAKNLSVVYITRDAEGLRDQLLKDDFSSITYDAPKPKDIVDEDKVIGAYKLNIKPENIRITNVDDVFAK